MKLIESNRKYILAGITAFIVVGLFVANVLANKQDEQFAYEDKLYAHASQLYTDGNYIDAMVTINELLELQPNSQEVNYLGGLTAANAGEYKQSAILLQKTMDINPYKVEDAIFMLQFGEILFLSERYEDAKVVLLECQKQGWEPEEYPNYQQRVTELLAQIEIK
mgnify:CR=1 FL=1